VLVSALYRGSTYLVKVWYEHRNGDSYLANYWTSIDKGRLTFEKTDGDPQ
jgi:hypothetical protein